MYYCREEETAQDIHDYQVMMNNMREVLSQDSPTPPDDDQFDQEVPEEIDDTKEEDSEYVSL
jgi:hypothetical protein